MLLGAIAFVIYAVSRYDWCFQDAEVLGEQLFDDHNRFRVLSYLGYIVTLETRLALWSVLPPHPSFTPLWVLTLLAGPVLLFKFLDLELRSRAAALAGVAVYLVSAGYLNGATMLFNTGKPLTNVAVIAVLYYSARLNREPRDRASWIALLLLLAAAPLADESGAFAFIIPLIWCPRVFWVRQSGPRERWHGLEAWGMYLLPALLVLLAAFVVLPTWAAVTGHRFSIIEYMTDVAQQGARYSKFDARHMIWQAGTLMMPGVLPWTLARITTPIAEAPAAPMLAVGGLVWVLTIALAVIPRRRPYRDAYRKAGIAIGVFIVFQTLVLVFHPVELAATGYYYGAIFSVLFAVLMAIAFADLVGPPWTTTIARLGLAWVVAMSAYNFPALNASWLEHSNVKALNMLKDLAIYGHGSITAPLQAAARDQAFRESQSSDPAEASYLADIVPAGPVTAAQDVFAIWRTWRQGDPEFLSGRPLAIRDLWLAVELDIKGRGTPRRWWTLVPGRARG